MKLITGYEFWWSPTFCSVIQLQKYDFLSKNSNPCLRKQLGFYNENFGFAKIVARCRKSKHDCSLIFKTWSDAPQNQSTMGFHRSLIFYVAKASKLDQKLDYDARNQSTISCFLQVSNLFFCSFKLMQKHLNSTRIA